MKALLLILLSCSLGAQQPIPERPFEGSRTTSTIWGDDGRLIAEVIASNSERPILYDHTQTPTKATVYRTFKEAQMAASKLADAIKPVAVQKTITCGSELVTVTVPKDVAFVAMQCGKP